MSDLPEKLRLKLLERGHKVLDIGDVKMDLQSGVITRDITLDDKKFEDVVFPDQTVDWEIIEKVLE